MFESFLANKFAAAKRFGLEGCETLVPGMKALIDRSTDLGVESIVMGMPHRGAPCTEQIAAYSTTTPQLRSGPAWLLCLPHRRGFLQKS